MRRLLTRGLPLAALVAIVVIGLSQSRESAAPPAAKQSRVDSATVRRALAGSPAPLAAIHAQANQLLGGGRDALAARLGELRGHPVVVNFWAEWCGPCRAELPIVQRASLDHGRSIAFLGVDVRDNAPAARRLLAQIPVTYPSYEDPSGRIFQQYKLGYMPSTVFLDARGRVTYLHQGQYLDRGELERQIRRYARADAAA